MRISLRNLLPSLLLSMLPTLLRAEDAARPAPRTVDYEWMSVATWKKKHADNVTRAAQGEADLVLLGDSITEGWQNTPLWENRFPEKRILNLGIGGDTTANVLWRLDNGGLGAMKPRLIVLLIGVNNLGRNHDKPAAVVRGVRTIVARLHATLPATKIMVLGILPADREPRTRMRKNIAKTNELLYRTLHDGHSIHVEDLGGSLLEADGTILPETMADFLHPTPRGYERLAAVLFPKVERLMRAP